MGRCYFMTEREIELRVDIDRDRIKEIVREALRMMYEYLGGEYSISQDQILETLDKLLDSNIVSTQFYLNVGSSKIPDLRLRVDPRRRKILGKSSFKKKVAKLNHFMRIL